MDASACAPLPETKIAAPISSSSVIAESVSGGTGGVLGPYDGPRALASIVRVGALAPIADADRVLAARVKGWTCVVAVAEAFAVGQLAVYFEIDALLPTGGPFDIPALSKSPGCLIRIEGIGERYRIKTRKLRGVVSQGLLMPLSAFGWSEGVALSQVAAPSLLPPARSPAAVCATDSAATFEGPSESAAPAPPEVIQEGLDVTLHLGVLKYEHADACPPSHAKGPWPQFLKKTDQERVQNCWARMKGRSSNDGEAAVVARFDAEMFEVTLKLDGTSCTVFHFNGETGVCSRNLQVKDGIDGGVYALLGDPIAAALKRSGKNVAIQGELLGPKISGNRERFLKPRFFAFDVWDIDAQRHWPAHQRVAFLAELGIESVPLIEITTLDKFSSVADVLAYAERPSIAHKIAEGVVFKSLVDPTVSFKAVSQSYLLKEM
jgi:RNA ligase (TIGR02306 family)